MKMLFPFIKAKAKSSVSSPDVAAVGTRCHYSPAASPLQAPSPSPDEGPLSRPSLRKNRGYPDLVFHYR